MIPPKKNSRLGLAALFALALPLASAAADNGLLFYLSAEKGTTADFAANGATAPTFDQEVTKIDGGSHGAALSCGDTQRLAWLAPGNIYAQRGTLSFFWRSRYPVGPTEFPVFRVGYGDHSSWDMVWLRIDYNGHGFDAFVTDASLARTRVSITLNPFPKPDEWVHLALAWDETRGIRFFVNGKLAAENKTTARYDAALDQFGPHSRIISPHNVQSDYNFVRSGDIDEIRIYDRMLDDAPVATLAKGEAPSDLTTATHSLADAATRTEWLHRYGWDRADSSPPELPAGREVTVRKVEIHDAFDMGRWWWKANDGIRETTWPGVYNRSRLPGRHDYFTLPDWDCYVDSGKAITFAMPGEPWNQIEISGAAWGSVTRTDSMTPQKLFDRPKALERSIDRLPAPITGGKVTFTNVEQEQPIGEFEVLNVTAGAEPAGSAKLTYRLGSGDIGAAGETLATYIAGRFESDERAVLVAQATDAPKPTGAKASVASLPIVHILIPDTWDKLTDGLDGIALDIPALNLKPTHGGLIALNVQVKDPLWPARDMLDFTFGVKPGEAKILWLDLRDRLLPAGKPLYLTIASASPEFSGASLEGSEIRLVFKPHDAARPEHELDRFTQARDSYAMLVEEHPMSPKLNLWVRFRTDLEDLLRVNPTHELGVKYASASGIGPRPPFKQPDAPAGVPLWAFRQTELLGRVKHFVEWYIDHRQSDFGDFGGGISDDVDLLNTWPGVALMGSDPDKLRDSLHRLIEAAFKNGMFTNGLPTIQADELHSYEEGINCLAQNLILDYGNPRQLERAMATARGVESITGINAAGHRHIKTSYYSGTKQALDEPWGTAKPYSYLVCQVPQLLVDFNGSPEPKKYLIELADGLLAHGRAGGRGGFVPAIRFADDKEVSSTRGNTPWHMYWAAWKFTGDARYLAPLTEGGLTSLAAINANVLDILQLRTDWAKRLNAGETAGPAETRRADGRGRSPDAGFRNSAMAHFTWQLNGDKQQLEGLYASQIETCANLEYINTEGSLWIDRVGVPYAELQRARLGGVALVRNALYPGHTVSWRFAAPANDQSVAILVNDATTTGFKVIAYNLESAPVHATMTGWNIDPGIWEIAQGIDTNDDDKADGEVKTSTATFERSRSVEVTLPPRTTTILTLKLKTPGVPYWSRPDLGICADDVQRSGSALHVTVHSLGAIPAPETQLALRDRTGRVLATAKTPALAAPIDLNPKTAEVSLTIPAGADLSGATLELDPDHALNEITALNNIVKL